MNVVIIDHPRKTPADRINDVANAPLSASLNTGYAAAVVEECGFVPVYSDFFYSHAAGGMDAEVPPWTMDGPVKAAGGMDAEVPPWTMDGPVKAAGGMDAEVLRLKEYQPVLLLVHWVYSWDNGEAVSRIIEGFKRMLPGIPVGAFGLFPTLCASLLLENSAVDFIFEGEFEYPLRDLLSAGVLNAESYEKIPGLATRQRGEIPVHPMESGGIAMHSVQRNDSGDKEEADLPVVKDLGKTKGFGYLNVAASRGCYGNCSFCFIKPYYRSGGWRGRSAEKVLEEIDYRLTLYASEDMRKIYFVDPDFLGGGRKDHSRVLAIAEGLHKRGLGFGFEARVNDIDRELISRLAEKGLESCFIGIESASPVLLKRMNKGITPEQSSAAIHILRDNGIFISAGFIMFDPFSTPEDLIVNYRFLEEHNLMDFHDRTANLLTHSPIVLKGTRAYTSLKRRGLVQDDPGKLYESSVLYKDPQVGAVAGAMNKITNRYFLLINNYWEKKGYTSGEQFSLSHKRLPGGLPETEINNLLKTTFLELLKKSGGDTDLKKITSEILDNLEILMTVSPLEQE